LLNNNEAARPMPLPAPVMMTDLPSRRPMHFSPLKFYIVRCFQRVITSSHRKIRIKSTLAALRNFKQDFKRRSYLNSDQVTCGQVT
jgi:hypothetical protein